MNVFVFEYVTGGGWFEQTGQPPESLLREANAMVQAIAADFAVLADVEVSLMRDGRLPGADFSGCHVVAVDSQPCEQEVFLALAARADWTFVIAPETGGVLFQRARQVLAAGGRLLSPSPECIELASNKQQTADKLHRQGVPVPAGLRWTRSATEPAIKLGLPLVAKPVDGCGSEGLRLITSIDALAGLPADGCLRVERFVPGLAASVAVLCGPARDFVLPACRQRLSRDGRFAYRGGSLPLAPPLNERAARLALAAMNAIGPRRGYLGVDLVLGESADGSNDYVIEINPRLTTSYVGLRAASQRNLAAALLAVAEGRQPDLEFAPGAIEFTAAGQILRSRRLQ